MTPTKALSCPGARATLYREAPSFEGRRTAAVGQFSCDSAEAGAALLNAARARLSAEGFGAVIGPMDGDTWHSYRLVAESDGSPPFLMEPRSGPHDRAAFEAAGFAPISDYVSARARLADAAAAAPAQVAGVTINPWDGADAGALIEQLYAMSTTAFGANRFFKPIDKAAFLKLYEPVMPFVDPRHVLFARDAWGGLVGYLFGIPDYLESTKPKTVILKTYASGLRGVGHALADAFHARALEMGYTHVIHALMHVDNSSRGRSAMHKADIFRRYALMGLRLAP